MLVRSYVLAEHEHEEIQKRIINFFDLIDPSIDCLDYIVEKPKDDDDLSGDLEENLSLEDYRKKVLEERLVKLTIGFSK